MPIVQTNVVVTVIGARNASANPGAVDCLATGCDLVHAALVRRPRG